MHTIKINTAEKRGKIGHVLNTEANTPICIQKVKRILGGQYLGSNKVMGFHKYNI